MRSTCKKVRPLGGHHTQCARTDIKGQGTVGFAMGDLESFETCAVLAGNGNDSAACIKHRNTQGPEAGFSRLCQGVLDDCLGYLKRDHN
jgi:hypothetical protein